MPHRCILTPGERTALLAFPSERSELIRLYTFSEQDLSVINQRRGDANRLGFAILMCGLRYPGDDV
jgi:TnpA family transposase